MDYRGGMVMEKMVLTASEVAKALGTRPDVIQRKLEAGDIPAYREGRNWKVPRMALEAYLIKRAEEEAEARREIAKEVKNASEN